MTRFRLLPTGRRWSVFCPLSSPVTLGRNQRRDAHWSRTGDFRLICSCQTGAHRRRDVWGRTTSLVSRGVAVLITIPLALAAFDLPIEAMNLQLDSFRPAAPTPARPAPVPSSPRSTSPAAPATAKASALPVFTTPAVRSQFLLPGARQREMTLEVFREAYFRSEIPYGPIIYREARRNHLPPELVAAMVHTESNFRPTLVSNKSAQGLMQIVPETARLLGVADPFDPEENIRAGTRYFRYLLGRFENETMALAAYNAGEGNVARFGGIPPFSETQQYIAKVRTRTSRYRDGIRSSYVAALRMRNDEN